MGLVKYSQHLVQRENKSLTLKTQLSLPLLSFAYFYPLQCLSFPEIYKLYHKCSQLYKFENTGDKQNITSHHTVYDRNNLKLLIKAG